MSERPVFRISVSDLADFCCRRGDLNLGLQRSPSAQEGQQGQRTVQKSKTAGYVKEVVVTAEWQQTLFTCLLGGRIDGVLAGDIPLLEEIKTTYCSQQELPDAQRAVHWAQLMLYGALYLQTDPAEQLHLQLCYLKLDDDSVFTFDKLVTADELQDFYQSCRQDYEQWLHWQCEHWQRRDTFLQGLNFPYSEFRQGQRTLSVQAYRDLRDGQRGLYQAATGLGKTLGILFPALKLLAEQRYRQIWYVTAKTSGQRSVLQALDQLDHRNDRPVRVLILSARERVCFCNPGPATICEGQKNFFDKWQSIRNDVQQQSHWNPDQLSALARQHNLCPHQLSLQLVPWADLIIADYNYVFDPAVRLSDYLDQHARHIALLVDEAHNLPDRARDMFSISLEQKALVAAAKTTADRTVKKQLKKVQHYFPAADTPAQAFAEPPADIMPALATLTEHWLEWFARQQWLVFPEQLFETLMTCARFAQRLQRWQPEDRWLCYPDHDTQTLAIFCTDPAPQLDVLTARFHAVLYFSGSLQPLEFFARALSQQPFTQMLELPSPFPHSHLLTLVIPVNTRYDARTRSIPTVADMISAVWQARPGRYLVSFPSYQYLQSVREYLQVQHPHLPLLVQGTSMADTTETFVQHLMETPTLALVIAGGRYAEGLDLPDNLLQGVIVVGTCMPPPSLQRELIQAHFQNAGCDGFDFAFRFPGLNRVIQSAGRVIRRETDRGMLILMDDRFTRQELRQHFPAHWQPQRINRPQDLAAPLLAFWQADL